MAGRGKTHHSEAGGSLNEKFSSVLTHPVQAAPDSLAANSAAEGGSSRQATLQRRPVTSKLPAPWVLLAAIILVGLGLGASMRAVRNPPVIAARTMEAHLTVPRDVENILTRSCKDCHSYETRWPWYSRLPFAFGIVGKDVLRARSYMNLSDWSATIAQGKGEEGATLNGICEELRSDSMPLPWYRRMHAHTQLSGAEVEAVCQWAAKTAAASVR